MSRDNYNKLSSDELDFVDDKTAALLLNTPNSARLMLWVMVLFFVAAIAWASWAQIDKVTVGQGKVIPSSQIQVAKPDYALPLPLLQVMSIATDVSDEEQFVVSDYMFTKSLLFAKINLTREEHKLYRHLFDLK